MGGTHAPPLTTHHLLFFYHQAKIETFRCLLPPPHTHSSHRQMPSDHLPPSWFASPQTDSYAVSSPDIYSLLESEYLKSAANLLNWFFNSYIAFQYKSWRRWCLPRYSLHQPSTYQRATLHYGTFYIMIVADLQWGAGPKYNKLQSRQINRTGQLNYTLRPVASRSVL
jgi:hypothetical protein